MVWSAIGHAKHALREQRIFGDLLPPPRRGVGVILAERTSAAERRSPRRGGRATHRVENIRGRAPLQSDGRRRATSEAAGASDDPTQAELLDDDAFRQVLEAAILSLEQLGCPANTGLADESELGFEWLMAQTELHRATAHARCVADICSALRSACRFASAAVEALTNRAREAKRRPTNYRAVGTDELLPAITFTMLRCNPERLGSIIWFASRFSQEEALQGEDGVALANFDAALSFLRRVATQPRQQLCGCDVERAPGEPAPPQHVGRRSRHHDTARASPTLARCCNASELLAGPAIERERSARRVAARPARDAAASRRRALGRSVGHSTLRGGGRACRRRGRGAPRRDEAGLRHGVEAGAMQRQRRRRRSRAVLSALLLVFGDAPTGDPSCAGDGRVERALDRHARVSGVRPAPPSDGALMRAASQGSLMLSLALRARRGGPRARRRRRRERGGPRAARRAHRSRRGPRRRAAPPRTRDARGEALSIALAAREGDARRVRGLLLLGADADELREGDAAACGGYTALIAAACHGDAALLRALLSRPAAALRIRCSAACLTRGRRGLTGELRTRETRFGRAPLPSVAPARHAALRATCATVDKPNALGETALMRAVGLQSGRRRASAASQVDAAKALLAAGASRTSRDARRRTALDWANACDNDGGERRRRRARRWGHERLVNILRLDPSRDAVFDAARDGKGR